MAPLREVLPFLAWVMQSLLMSRLDSEAYSIARRQGGVVTSRQVLELGFSRPQVDYRLGNGSWRPVVGLGYRLLPPIDSRDHLRSAVSLLPQAVVCRESAAGLHGLTGVVEQTPAVAVHSRTTNRFPGVSVHRCHDLSPEHICLVDELRVTTVARTIVDLAIDLTSKHLLWVADRAIDDRKTSAEEISRVASAVARRGKPGTARARQLIDDLDAGGRVSPLEQRGRALLSKIEGMPERVSEFPLPWAPHRRFDDAYPTIRLAIEWDSYRFHGQRDSFEADRGRDQDAIANGWRVLRFTWRDVTETSDAVIEILRAAASHRVS